MTRRTKKAWTKWRELISEQARSGQTVTAFCRERGLCRPCFFQTKKYGLHSPRSRQNAVTVCPLRACSEISSRHFVQAFFVRRVMAQHCYTRAHPARCGSLIAHGNLQYSADNRCSNG